MQNTHGMSGIPRKGKDPVSEIKLVYPNGYGSSYTGFRRYLTIVKNVGADLTYIDDVTRGARIKVNTDGLYFMSFGDQNSAASLVSPVILVNPPATLTSPGAAASAYVNQQASNECYCTNSAAGSGVGSGVSYLYAGDEIQVYEGNAQSSASGTNYPQVWFAVTKIG